MQNDWISSQTLSVLNQGFVVAIILEAKEGEAEAVADILRRFTPPTRGEAAVKLVQCYRSPKNPSQFFVLELYESEAGWTAHEATPHFKTAVEQLLPRVIRRERLPFAPFLPG